MPTLDVSDVLSDPAFQDTCSIVVTTRVIGSNGVPTDTAATPFTLAAVIEPDKTSMVRLADGSRLAGSIFIYTLALLSTGLKSSDTASRLADVVTWNGRQYVVRQVEDWSSWGQGYWRVAADLIQLNASM